MALGVGLAFSAVAVFLIIVWGLWEAPEPAPAVSENQPPLSAADAQQALIEMLELEGNNGRGEWPADVPDFVWADTCTGKAVVIVDDQNPWSRVASGDDAALAEAMAAEGHPQFSAWKWNCNLQRRTVAFWGRHRHWWYVMTGEFIHVRGKWHARMRRWAIT
jgi:hypothetical protein